MAKRLLAALVIVMVGAALAWTQSAAPTATPVASFPLEGSGVLAFMPDANMLLAGDGPDVLLYDLNAANTPRQLGAVTFGDTPAALAAAGRFALAAIPFEGEADRVWVIAPDRYNASGYAAIIYFDIPKNPHVVALSPDNAWGFAAGDSGYITMRLYSPEDIGTSAVFETGDSPVIAAALTDSTAYFIREGVRQVETLDLTTTIAASEAARALALDAQPTSLRLNPDITQGAVALANNTIILFNPEDLTALATLQLDDGPVADMRFLRADGRDVLALRIDNRSAIILYDVTDPQNTSLPGIVEIGAPVEALAAFGDQLALRSADSVQIYAVSP
jgi:hypothetical protein